MKYYQVALALKGSWNSTSYTYSHDGVLETGHVVICPFGPKQIMGFVIDEVEKPEFVARPIDTVTDFVLPTSVSTIHGWLQAYYPGVPGPTTQNFLPSFLKKLDIEEAFPTRETELVELPTLTELQTDAVQRIRNASSKSIVLHGVTGSGKTRVYMELAQEQLDKGKDVLVLYPEISLTTQLKKTLSRHFGTSRVHVYNSKRTPKEQRATWLASYRSSQKEPAIFIGPRSALFLPHTNLGLVVIDESHESSYKQDSGSRYSGLILAAKLANDHGARIIYGSATPPVSETWQLLSKGSQMVCMHKTAIPTETSKTLTTLIDMTDKSNISKASYLLSKPLLSQIKKSLDNKKQSLLFINRRGTAKLLSCDDCGWHAECSSCDMPLTYHHDSHDLKCHICGNTERATTSCPDCHSSLSQKTQGIKAIEAELTKLFPYANIARFDSDNKKSDSLSERFSDVSSGEIDILIGTQLITKGLDLPLLETVGILQADSALFLPDYTSEEKTFQQLVQVSGRVGRGHSDDASYIFLQSHNHRSSILAQVVGKDWHSFYNKELISREKSLYPPYRHLLKISFVKSTQLQAQNAAQKLSISLHSKELKMTILGPAPSFYEKNGGKYSWQLLVKSYSRQALLSLIEDLPKDALIDLDPASLL
jgi:primosomal protein N' (replication factor Y)